LNKLKEIIKPYGKWGYIRVVLSPLTTLFTTPYRLAKTLWACRILANGKLTEYNNFTPNSGLLNLWYWTLALNISRYGRSGKLKYIGLDDFPLSRHFSYSLPSLYAYWCSSNITVLSGMFGWWVFHVLWITPDNFSHVALVMTITLISTTFYANTFSMQHYNALGWLFCPIGIYGLYSQNWELAGLGWLLTSFGSFTVVFLGGILSLSEAIIESDSAPALAFLPAAFKMLTHFWPNYSQKNAKQTFLEIGKLIGFFHRNVKYNRRKSWLLSLGKAYHALIYIQFCIAATVGGFETSLLWTGLGIFYINSTRFRFADDQSPQMLILGLATALMIKSESIWLLPFYWILVSPIPCLADFPFKKVLDVVPQLYPFPIKPFLTKMEDFLKPIQKQQKIILAFYNPQNQYNNIFDGLKTLVEPLRYVATQKEITLIPTQEAIIGLNYEGAPDCWGREINEVSKNAIQWKANYVLIYQEESTILEKKWIEAGFQVIKEMDWKSFEELNAELLFPKPKWWLLKIPTRSN
jgi:hypothetical protein